MKILKYVVVDDTGLAPNPYGKWCTLAVCTPNHKNAQIEIGDWIVGHSTKKTGNKLIYAMKVSEVLDFQEYFYDPRFQYKKPKLRGQWWEFTGDNIYRLVKNKWVPLPNPYHDDDENFRKDTKYHVVFISKKFYYFGKNSNNRFPQLFPGLIQSRQNFSYEKNEAIINTFVDWLKKNFEKGMIGKPTDLSRKPSCGKKPKKPKC